MPQANANNIRIEYETFGASSDPTILLIMGMGMQMIAWPELFCRELAAQGFHVIRYDNRDTGLSTKFDGVKVPGIASLLIRHTLRWPIRVPYTLRHMADDAVGLLDSFGIEKAHVIGASMGGMIAQNVAAAHPERLHSLVSLMSTSGNRSLPRTDPVVTRHLFRSRPDSSNREAVIAHNMRSMELIGSPDFPVDEESRREMATMSYDRSFYPAGFARHVAAIVQDGDRRPRLRTIKTPTLVIHGREDLLVPVAGGIDTAEHIAGSQLEIIDGLGHNLPTEIWPQVIGLMAEHARQSRTTTGVEPRLKR